jgi:hypothetical protein
MKTITIGRGDGVDIFIDDEMISRRHALLRIYASGKMEIVDMGKNGTFVNGVKLKPNVPFPVKRKDVVNFAEVSRLNWSQVPDNTKYFKIGAIIIGAILALLILFGIGSFCYNKFFAKEPAPIEYNEGTEAAPVKTEGRIENSDDKAKKEEEKADEKKKDDQKDLSGKKVQELFPSAPKKDAEKGKTPQKGNNKPDKNDKGKDQNQDQGKGKNQGAIV